MTTTIKVHVNGKYKATVTQDQRPPVEIIGDYDGTPNPGGVSAFTLQRNAETTLHIKEEPIE